MNVKKASLFVLLILLVFISCNKKPEANSTNAKHEDPLPSWNEVNSKTAIIEFVESAINPDNKDFIPIKDRIATFDNDGNLWSEQPAYFQLYFAIDRIKSIAKDHPEWNREEPFLSILNDDLSVLKKMGMEGLMQLVMTSHAGMSTDEFDFIVKEWDKNALHPTKKVPFSSLVYLPMLELLEYLRANDFKTYIVSGGGVDFMRAIFPEIYGIPEEQIIGSRINTAFDYHQGTPRIIRTPGLEFIDDKEGKPLNIQKIIGKKPVFASGNSDGDLQMLQWTASNHYKSFMLYLHHTDPEREWAYDRDSHIGRLDKGLDQAKQNGWTVIDMKKDWKVVFSEK